VSKSSQGSSKTAFDAGNGFFVTATYNSAEPIDYIGTVRGRFGYLLSNPLLIYVTGGLAYSQVDNGTALTTAYPLAFVVPNNPVFGGTSLRAGYALGGGLEYKVTQRASLKLEGLYYDLGEVSSSTTFRSYNTGATLISAHTVTKSRDLNGAIGRVGVNFSF
jgi:outer membrane immunogenic protein